MGKPGDSIVADYGQCERCGEKTCWVAGQLKAEGREWRCDGCGQVALLPASVAPHEAPLGGLRAIVARVTHLELTVLPALKGEPERILRELIWAAHDQLKARPPRLRKCEVCGGPGPTLHDPRTHRYACQKCHSEPRDQFFQNYG